jgi:hypothetical protein
VPEISEPLRDDGAIVEHALDCPYCWEPITVLVDTSVSDQEYVEDCEVCCNPIQLLVRVSQGVVALEAQRLP